jgi:hypothetical protein
MSRHISQTCVLHPVGSVSHVVNSGASGECNDDPLFFMLRWYQYGFNKKFVITHYAKILFLHLVGSMGHVVHSDASGTRTGDTLFFMLRWDRHRFDKKTRRHMLG